MQIRQLIVLLLLGAFITSLTGCGKTSNEKLAAKKAKEIRNGDFHNPPAKSY